jgi:hypothetical protein
MKNMFNFKSKLLILLVPLLLSPTFVQAETVLRISDSISILADQTVDGDFYGTAGLSGPISMSGSVNGDALLAGRSVTTNGAILGDLLILSGSAQVHASVTDDVRIVAADVTLADYVGGDVFVIGGLLKVLSTAEVAGNIFFYGETAEINGKVGGSIFGTSKSLRIDGPVGGSVEVVSNDSLVIGSRADISGDITYDSPNEIVRAQDAIVVGNISKQHKASSDTDYKNFMLPFIVYAFMVLITFVLLRNKLTQFVQLTALSFTRNGLIGLAALLGTPLLVGLLFVSVLGILVGLTLLFGMLFLFLLSLSLAPILVGKLINHFIFKTESITFLSTLLGVVVIEIVFLVPLIGPAMVVALLAVVLGNIINRIYQSLS